MFVKAALFTTAILAGVASAAPHHKPHAGSFKPPLSCGSSAASTSTTTAPPQETTAAAQMMISTNQTNQTTTCGSGATSALYFMTNEPTGNFLVTSAINSDGTVKVANAYYTGGNGSAGQVAAPGPDALFSQDSIKVGGSFLFNVNAGSNTVTMFNINQQDPTILQMVGQPQSTSGDFPMAVAFNPKTNMACVANGGASNGVSCFMADPKVGLIPLQNSTRSLGLNQTTPPNGPPMTLSDVIFSADGSRLTVSVKGVPPTPGFLATWDVASDGTLSPDFTKATPAAGGLLPFSLSLIPGKPDAFFATDAGVGFATFDFSKSDNASSVIVPVGGQGAICWANFSPKSGTFFMNDIAMSIVTEAKVDDNLNATIVKQYNLAPGSGPIDNAVATIGGQDFFYILSANATSIDVLSIPGEGQATPVQTLNIQEATADMKLTINPFHLQGMATFPSLELNV